MLKTLIAIVSAVVLTGCATTGQVDAETRVIVTPPRTVYVHPHHPWVHHHWHWGWHHRHGWGVHHPRIYHAPQHHHHRRIDDQRRTVPTPVNPGQSGGPRGEHLK